MCFPQPAPRMRRRSLPTVMPSTKRARLAEWVEREKPALIGPEAFALA